MGGRCSNRTTSKTSIPTLNEQRNPRCNHSIRYTKSVFCSKNFFKFLPPLFGRVHDNGATSLRGCAHVVSQTSLRLRPPGSRSIPGPVGRLIGANDIATVRLRTAPNRSAQPTDRARHQTCHGWRQRLLTHVPLRGSTAVPTTRALTNWQITLAASCRSLRARQPNLLQAVVQGANRQSERPCQCFVQKDLLRLKAEL